ncbi:staurosporin and temperature sensitive 3-like b [Prunus dulcis]|uniref:Staurosporin and temperature sensitive 3-like b n=1 Tax=Prunus dulcis TaxID=3755 RepID=A0A4Y1RDW0_PRUDU|nr:staurosporin and temperature sensitive 3-like b [Prunus dulcis]
MENIGKGLIRDGTGTTFPVKYQCVVFRPFKGEILEVVVTMVNKVCFPLLPIKVMASIFFVFSSTCVLYANCGKYVMASPVQIFVSNHLWQGLSATSKESYTFGPDMEVAGDRDGPVFAVAVPLTGSSFPTMFPLRIEEEEENELWIWGFYFQSLGFVIWIGSIRVC